MHVAYYSPSWPPGKSANGIITYVSQMRDYLLSRGHEVTVFTGNVAHLSDNSTRQLADTLPLSAKLRGRFLDKFWPGTAAYAGAALSNRLARSVREIGVEIFEIEESFGWAHYLDRTLSLPVVMRLHGPHYLGKSEPVDRTAARHDLNRIALERRALESAKAITSPSAAMLEDVRSKHRLSARFLEAIPNPISLAETTWSLDRCDKRSVLMVGRLDKRKGFDVALRAFSRLAKKHGEARLFVVGPPGPNGFSPGSELKAADLEPFGLDPAVFDRVHLLGLLSPAQITELRQQALVTIMCSRFENFPYSGAEAMAMGCPFISTRSFHSEMVIDGETGFLVDQEDDTAMADRMDWLFQNKEEARRVGEAARKRATTVYASNVVGAQMETFYERVKSGWR